MQKGLDSYYFTVLSNELRARQKRNRAFSVRAFALFLKIDSGSLSAIMKGNRRPTLIQAKAICSRLELNLSDTKKFLKSVKSGQGMKKLSRVQPKKLNTYQLNSGDQQTVLAWEHYAILCLIDFEGFDSSSEWIAKRLNISTEKVQNALARLKSLDLILEDEKNRIRKKFEGNFSFEKVSPGQQLSSALETVDMITTALKSREHERTLFCSVTMPVDPGKFKEVSDLVTEFQLRLAALAEGEKPQAVYRLALGLFPLTAHIPRA